MSRKLYLIRHSYAEHPNDKPDFERKLTHEGQAAVRALGRHLINVSFDPHIILSSTALRARETAINLVEELGINEHIIEYKDVIYNASVRELLSTINELSDEHHSVALIGHNPTITFFGEYITGAPVDSMDPAGVITISIENQSWSELSQAIGIFEGYYHPNNFDV